jgi:hypothetical protein
LNVPKEQFVHVEAASRLNAPAGHIEHAVEPEDLAIYPGEQLLQKDLASSLLK